MSSERDREENLGTKADDIKLNDTTTSQTIFIAKGNSKFSKCEFNTESAQKDPPKQSKDVAKKVRISEIWPGNNVIYHLLTRLIVCRSFTVRGG